MEIGYAENAVEDIVIRRVFVGNVGHLRIRHRGPMAMIGY
jgi:hypothetical protein